MLSRLAYLVASVRFWSLQKLPRVDVGSLEEVIGRMEQEQDSWSDVVFIPPRSVAAVGESGSGK